MRFSAEDKSISSLILQEITIGSIHKALLLDLTIRCEIVSSHYARIKAFSPISTA